MANSNLIDVCPARRLASGPENLPGYVAQHERPPMRSQIASICVEDANLNSRQSTPSTQRPHQAPACGSGQLRIIRATDTEASPTCRRTGTESLAFPAA